jgi:hypothetical protein
VQAKDRREAGEREMLPVNSTAIRLFSQKAVVDGALDPVAAKHLVRVVRSKFESEPAAEAISERMLHEADSLASKFYGLFPHSRILRDLPEVLRPSEAYQHICSDSYWYLYYTDSDRIRLARSYLELQHHEDYALFTRAKINSFYHAASLILDSLPKPNDIRRSSGVSSPATFESFDPNELPTITSKAVRENGWERDIARLVLQRLEDLPASTQRQTLAKIFFGPQVSALKAVGVSGHLDKFEEVKAAVDQGRLNLLKRLEGAVLKEVAAEGFRTRVLMRRLKFCGGGRYRELANARFEALQ